jgi:hypothetical protein
VSWPPVIAGARRCILLEADEYETISNSAVRQFFLPYPGWKEKEKSDVSPI